MVKKRAKPATAAGRKVVVAGKNPVVLSNASRESSMSISSSLAFYWLSMLALVILGMLIALLVGVLEVLLPGSWVLVIVAALGLFFGFVAHNLVSLVENLEAGHHLFAKVLVPSASVLILLLISISSANFARSFGFLGNQNSLLIVFVYGVALVIPSLK